MRNVKRHRTEIRSVNNFISHSERVGDVATGKLKLCDVMMLDSQHECLMSIPQGCRAGHDL